MSHGPAGIPLGRRLRSVVDTTHAVPGRPDVPVWWVVGDGDVPAGVAGSGRLVASTLAILRSIHPTRRTWTEKERNTRKKMNLRLVCGWYSDRFCRRTRCQWLFLGEQNAEGVWLFLSSRFDGLATTPKHGWWASHVPGEGRVVARFGKRVRADAMRAG
jgi:hypothetical protein